MLNLTFDEFVDQCRFALEYYNLAHFDFDYFINELMECLALADWWQSHLTEGYDPYATYSYHVDYDLMAELVWNSSTDYETEYCNECNEFVFSYGECSGQCDPDLNWETPSEADQVAYLREMLEEVMILPGDQEIEEYIRSHIWKIRQEIIESLIPGNLKEDIQFLLDTQPDYLCYDSILWVHNVMSLYHASGNLLEDYGGISYVDVDEIRENGLQAYFEDCLEELIEAD